MQRARPRPVRICQRTGFKVPADELVEDGETGALVWGPYYDPRHPSQDMPAPRGEQLGQNPTGPDFDVHLEPGDITWDDL